MRRFEWTSNWREQHEDGDGPETSEFFAENEPALGVAESKYSW